MLISIGFSLITGTDKGLRVAYSGFSVITGEQKKTLEFFLITHY